MSALRAARRAPLVRAPALAAVATLFLGGGCCPERTPEPNGEKPVATPADGRPRPDPARRAERLVLEARLTDLTPLPPPHVLKEYPRALVVHQYQVVRVIAGACRAKRILVAHWAILNRQPLREAARFREGETYRLTLERHEDHPELQTERLLQDGDWLHLPLYYDVEWLAGG